MKFQLKCKLRYEISYEISYDDIFHVYFIQNADLDMEFSMKCHINLETFYVLSYVIPHEISCDGLPWVQHKHVTKQLLELLAYLPLDKIAAILADDIFKWIFLNENRIPIQISLRFVPKNPIDNKPP